MNTLTRRGFAASILATTGLAACGNGIGGNGAGEIDARVAATQNFMFTRYPGTQDLANRAAGMLIMPLITEAGLGIGGSYGRGALKIGETTVDYYSATTGSAGFQIGVQQSSQVLFFMTQDALLNFRQSDGWAAGADVEYAISDQGETLSAQTTTSLSPVIAVIFAQTGLRVGATLEGIKYTRIIP